ncbi:MAG: sigma-54 dependent transcriptional regulator [Vicinamibacterales bacterium]|nr:sigma-54 dependent transcriptional regulator [Vicinamibacterales bacterium]
MATLPQPDETSATFASRVSTSRRGQPCVLVIEDEEDLRLTIAESLEAGGFAVAQAPTAAEAHERIKGFAYDAIVVDLRLPDGDGMEVLDAALERYPQIAAIVITGFGGVQEAVSAIRRGAKNFLLKPFQLSVLTQELRAFVNEPRLRAENAELRAQLRERYRFDNIIGQSGPMQQIFQTLELVAPMNSTVMIHGETGTGKELIARTLHHNSARASERFVAFNAAAIPDGLAEAEMFGHTKGAFTGAINDRMGRFEQAHRGTLFIDEVALMPMSLQTKLLRALQEREIERVGGSKPIKFDTRVIAASNCDLKKLVQDGTFREDLYYRLNVIPITLPPLRDRKEDIALLARHFVQKSCKSNGLAHKTISQEALRCLMGFAWPGNIRQLENAIEHAVAMSGREPEIALSVLPDDMTTPERAGMRTPVNIPDEGISFVSVVSQLERDLILKGLEKTRGNKRQAARLLGLSRTTLIDKIHRLDIDAPNMQAMH